MSVLALLLIGQAVASLVMSGVWLLQRSTGKAGFVDVAWTWTVGALAIGFAAASDDGLAARRILLAVLIGLWSLRLGIHLLLRVLRHSEDDARYRRMKEEWGASAQMRLFFFFQSQAIGAMVFAAAILIVARSRAPLGIGDWLGVALWAVAMGGEALADWQLAKFRGNPENGKRVCDIGLWRYSRHPNYFFEWLHWWSYVAMAATAPWGWLTIGTPLAMLYLFLYVTGIPPAEQQSLKSRGDAYRKYQRTTSAFVPWPPTGDID